MRNIIAVVFILFASVVQSADFQKGLDAYNKGDFKIAYKEWNQLAAQGNANAQYNLGVMYANGNGVPKDYKQVVHWYHKAAGQGDAGAQYNLGVMYEYGIGVLQDYKNAYMWFNLARYNGKNIKDTLDFITPKMTSKSINEAQSMSRVCLESNYKSCG
jgi:hypothetical protein